MVTKTRRKNSRSNTPNLPAPFTPVPLRPRHDGWMAQKQVAFIRALAETACVEHACRHVGMTVQSAYRLRRRECGAAFRQAWDGALDYSLQRLEQAAVSRALNGVPRPVFHNGEQVGEWRTYDERLTMFLLRNRRPQRFGRWIERVLVPDVHADSDPAFRMADDIEQIWSAAPLDDGNPEEANEE